MLLLAEETGISDEKCRALHLEAFRQCIQLAIQDDGLSEEEEARLSEIAAALAIGQLAGEEELEDLLAELAIGRVSNGRLPVLSSPKIILKKGEVAHMSTEAFISKQVAVRGTGRWDKSIIVGYATSIADAGLLTVTSQRIVYTGERKTVEIPYSKLVSLNLADGNLRFHLSSCREAPSFDVSRGHGRVVAAIVNAYAQV